MKEPTLVILAAGMGSRFGGLKQMTPVDGEGHFIIDFSLYDAYQAGFRRVAFIIKHEIEKTFRETIGARMEKFFHVAYVYQELDCLPEGFSVPAGRKKPWGTAHAVACCRGVVDGNFAVINSDDFYGRGAYEEIYRFLTENETPHHYAMLGYQLRNTVTEFGSVARGICHVENGLLTDVVERTHIEKRGSDGAYTEDGTTFIPLSGDTLVSMNCWGFSALLPRELEARFPVFLRTMPDPLKSEFFLPTVADAAIHEGLASVQMLHTDERWYGVTYHEDRAVVAKAMLRKAEEGEYPRPLWGKK